MTHRTVKSLADAERPEDLFRGQWQYNRTSALDEYKPYLDERWDEGCTNAWKLWKEIVPLGYQGSYGIISTCIRKKRTSPPRPVTARPPVPRVVTRWILSRPETLTELEQLRLKAVLAECPALEALASHVRFFAWMLTERRGERLPRWLDAVRQDDLPSLHSSPQASTETATPSSLASPCPGIPVLLKDTSTESRCSNARCSAEPASISSASVFCSTRRATFLSRQRY
jgi:hypothetical protein